MEIASRCPPEIEAQIRACIGALALPRSGTGEDAALLVGALTGDATLALATLAHEVFQGSPELRGRAAALFGSDAAAIERELARLGEFGLPKDWRPERGLDARQAETLRKLLLAIVGDPRLVVARVALQLARLRAARELDEDERRRLGSETRELYAPLANRLGIWQLKWELEDLAFRWLEPEPYRTIALALNEKRGAREAYIDALCERLRVELAREGVRAEVQGRPKHIYSIHRKMQRKRIAFEQVFDVRAVRILCDDIASCYAALGVVHGLWPYIPGEFDDYIATPKENAYRSIHTAVTGPEGRSVEVQIRTREMHEHAELGVAAHWRYKEGGRDTHYDERIRAVRALIGHAQVDGGDFIDRMQAGLFADRVYAMTPTGDVVDLPQGATPLDFAYQLHSSLGHRCRGAKVNGRIVPLTHALGNGEVVEIITAKTEAPSRDWMSPEQGFLASARNRAKVRAWFRQHDEAGNHQAGRQVLERELAKHAGGQGLLPALLHELKSADAESLHRRLGEGQLSVHQLEQAIARVAGVAAQSAAPEPAAPRRRAPPVSSGRSPVAIEGVGDLPVTLARCCGPVRPQRIEGYVTLGRGVTVHRADCRGLARMRLGHPERVLQVEWTERLDGGQTIELRVVGLDRRGLVRDITDVVAEEQLSLRTLATTADRSEGTASTTLSVIIPDLARLQRLISRLEKVPNVLNVRRIR